VNRVILESTLLTSHGFVHGFATRDGGVSTGRFASLNLGRGLGDDESAVTENLRRFFAALGLSAERAFEVNQVHGEVARFVSRADRPDGVRVVEADALVALEPGLGVFVRTADCVPVLLAHPGSGAVAAVHAGWRGAVANIVPKTLTAAAARTQTAPAEWLAVIGPHIRVGAFEIGDEVALAMEAAAREGVSVVSRDYGLAPHGDLASLVHAQLRSLGIPANAIDDVGGCTHDEPSRFFSHRREKGRTGRHLSGIVAR
jgi:polyphenol oxidase